MPRVVVGGGASERKAACGRGGMPLVARPRPHTHMYTPSHALTPRARAALLPAAAAPGGLPPPRRLPRAATFGGRQGPHQGGCCGTIDPPLPRTASPAAGCAPGCRPRGLRARGRVGGWVGGRVNLQAWACAAGRRGSRPPARPALGQLSSFCPARRQAALPHTRGVAQPRRGERVHRVRQPQSNAPARARSKGGGGAA